MFISLQKQNFHNALIFLFKNCIFSNSILWRLFWHRLMRVVRSTGDLKRTLKVLKKVFYFVFFALLWPWSSSSQSSLSRDRDISSAHAGKWFTRWWTLFFLFRLYFAPFLSPNKTRHSAVTVSATRLFHDLFFLTSRKFLRKIMNLSVSLLLFTSELLH